MIMMKFRIIGFCESKWNQSENSPTSTKVTTLHIMNNAAFALFHNSKTSCSSVVS